MTPFKSLLRLILFIVLFLNCWERQRHAIQAPETPHYCFSGNTRDLNTDEILPDINIELIRRDLLFESDFTSAIDTTDSLGNYNFSSVVPGSYQLLARKGIHQVFEKNVLIINEDRFLQLHLPGCLVTTVQKYKGIPSELRFSGFHWKYEQTMAGVAIYENNNEYRVFEGNFQEGFSVVGKKRLPPKNPSFYGVTFLNHYWLCQDSNLVFLNSTTGQIDASIKLPFELVDLTNDGERLWASTRKSKILKFEPYPSRLYQEIKISDSILGGIAANDNDLWIFNPEQFLVYQFDHDLNLRNTYRLFYLNEWYNSEIVTNAKFMAFDFSGNLWVGDENQLFVFDKIDFAN